MNKAAITLALLILTSTSYANPRGLVVDIACPDTKSPEIALTNYGSYVAGYGYEFFRDVDTRKIYFKSEGALAPTVPSDLTNYYHTGVNYDSTSGKVTCQFSSQKSDEAPFSVAYILTNGLGATVLDATSNGIELEIPVGLGK